MKAQIGSNNDKIQATHDVKKIKEQWTTINDSLTTDWPDLSSLPVEARQALTYLKAQAIFSHKVDKFILLNLIEV